MGKMGNFWKAALWVKGSILVAGMGAYVAFENNITVKEAEYNLFDKKQAIEQHYFADPPGLETIWQSNSKGNIETYLTYNSDTNKRKVEVMHDLLPKEKTMIDGLKNRFKNNKIYGSDKTKDYLELAKTDFKYGEKPSQEELDDIIKNSLAIFKAAYSAKNNLTNNQESLLNNISFEIKDDGNGKNELYLKLNNDSKSYTAKIDTALFQDRQNSFDKEKNSIYQMFKKLDSVYTKN